MPQQPTKKLVLVWKNLPNNLVVGTWRKERKPIVTDIFDSTRRKIANHISTDIAPSVFVEKDEIFKAKVREIADLSLADPKLHKRMERWLYVAALEHMQKYFKSTEFKKKCREVAKGMIK